MTSEKELQQAGSRIRSRFLVAIVLMLLVFLPGIAYCIFTIQFREKKAWERQRDLLTRDSVLVPAPRGRIYSSDGALMAATIPTYALYIDFRTYEGALKTAADKDTARQRYRDTLEKYIVPLSKELSRKLGDKTPAEYERFLRNGFQTRKREFLLCPKRVSYFDYEEISRFPFFEKGRYKSGFYYKTYPVREKIFGSLASCTIGDIYSSEQTSGRVGRSGLELTFDSLLQGTPGWCTREKVRGRYMSVVHQEPIPGWDVHTTLNLSMQDIAESALRDMLTKVDASVGTVILMETSTGCVRAISNLRRQSGGYVEDWNFAVYDRSEPGSTFKTIAMMAAIEEGRIHPDDPVDVGNGVKNIHGRVMRDHNYTHGGYGLIDAKKSIWYSSNIGIALLIDEAFKGRKEAHVLIDRIYNMGFKENLQLQLPRVERPLIPHPKDKDRYWSATDLPWLSTGYVVAIPPIYTLAYYNAIANNGCYIKPYFVEKIARGDQVKQRFGTEVINPKICSDRTLHEIKLMLDSVVIKGTGRGSIYSEVVPISGKTGTAVLNYNKQGQRSHQVSFCGYFPSDQPKYTCLVVIREPRNGYPSGGTMAGGVFRRIAEQIYSSERVQDIARLPADTADRWPQLKSGRADATRTLLKAIDVKAEFGDLPYDEAVVETTLPPSKRMHFEARMVQDGLVPDVKGLGLRDALYVLEKQGLRVSVEGKGAVVYQSLPPGRKCQQGQSISLRLAH